MGERRRSKSRLESTASVDSQKKQKKQKVNEGEKSAPKEPKQQKKQQQSKKSGKKKGKGSKTKVKVNSLVKLISEITIPCMIIICFDVLEICSKHMSTTISSQFILNIFQSKKENK